jgi:hypothetical protein
VKDKLEHNAAAIKRWRTRLKRAMSMLDKLERQRKRLEAKAEAPPKPKTVTLTPAKPVVNNVTDIPFTELPIADDLAIPPFLQRKKLDPVAAEIAAEQKATKLAKSRGRIDKMKAKQRGDLKRMPLTGKAALEAIRNG